MPQGNMVFAEYGQGAVDPSKSRRETQIVDASGRPLSANGYGLCQLDLANRFIDTDGRVGAALPYSDAAGEAVIWFSLLEGAAGGGTFSDASGQLSGSIAGGAYAKRYAGQKIRPGVSTNGTNNRIALTTGASGGFTHAARRIGDLASLTAGVDMIVFWFVNGHGAAGPAADSAIWSWGLNNDAAGKGGYAVGLKGTTGKPTIWYRAKNGAATSTTIMGTEGARGKNADNTRTVTAIEIFRSYTAAYLEVRGYQLTLFTDGGNNQSNVGTATLARNADGTGAVNYDATTPLMLLNWCDTTSANFTKGMAAGMNAWNCGAIRRQFDPGVGMRICRSIRQNPYEFPASIR